VARGVSLGNLLTAYRYEINASGNPEHNRSVADAQVRRLQKTQEMLWQKHAWPHLRRTRSIDLVKGTRYYFPPSICLMERIEMIEVRFGGQWLELHFGLDASHFAVVDSSSGEEAWPVERWDIFEGDEIEVWPIPSGNGGGPGNLEGVLRLTFIRNLNPLVAPNDTADLDDDLIVKFAAASELARSGAKNAQIILQEAQRIEADLTGGFSKKKDFRLFGGRGQKPPYRRYPPRVHYQRTT
jgi:hypothetical protein